MGISPAVAEVAVLSNRTQASVNVEILFDGSLPQPIALAVGDSRPIFFQRTLRVRYRGGGAEQEHQLEPQSAYFFAEDKTSQELFLEEIGLGKKFPAKFSAAPRDFKTPFSAKVVPVKILVDDDEPTHRRLWEPKLRKRVAEASKVLERHSGVKLNVVAVETWDSNSRQHDLNQSLLEFEREVNPQPASLAIGFSSQYQLTRGRVHMGGTRGALHPYILLKERSRSMRETEKLELLVHELGHYLGASHSPEPQSVMRPLLTGGLQRSVGSRIQFDPVNTLLMAMLGDEMRRRDVTKLTSITVPTRQRLEAIYAVLRQALPQDPAAGQYLRILSRPKSSPPQQFVSSARRVLQQLVRVTTSRRRIAESRKSSADGEPKDSWLSGDTLTSFYVKQAALATIQIEPANPEQAFLLALGLFIDDSNALREFPGTSALAASIEHDAALRQRLNILGSPTMLDRADLVKHFFVSAHITVALGVEAAKSLGFAKEMNDAAGGTGFSFVDMAANRAGIEFAQRVLAGDITLEQLSQRFDTREFLPPIDDLEEGLSAEVLKDRFGDADNKSLQDELRRIEQRVLELPIYRK